MQHFDVLNKRNARLKHIAVSEKNYFTLKRLGGAGDSFNDVLTEVLNKADILQSDSRVPARDQTAISSVTLYQGGPA
jgi:hypothetical protein